MAQTTKNRAASFFPQNVRAQAPLSLSLGRQCVLLMSNEITISYRIKDISNKNLYTHKIIDNQVIQNRNVLLKETRRSQ